MDHVKTDTHEESQQQQPQKPPPQHTASTKLIPDCPALETFQLYGWKPQPNFSADENFLDLLVLVTRNSLCHAAGHMGCIVVRPPSTATAAAADTSSQHGNENDHLLGSIIAAANNQPLYKKNSSDVHAEVTVISQCAKAGISTAGCTIYVTMPPCKTCLGALVMAGITRIVFLNCVPEYLKEIGTQNGIQVDGIPDSAERRQRVETLVRVYNEVNGIDAKAEVERLRQLRKQEKQERQKKRKFILLNNKKNIHPSQLGYSEGGKTFN